MPVYNGEKYLEKSINSILNQTFNDWELIIVDDCSSDGSMKIMKKYASINNKIKIINNEKNLKLPKALNVGFKEAKGKYFTWTSDDNMYEKYAIETMYKHLENNPDCGLVYCDMWNIDELEHIVGETKTSLKELYYNNCIGACFMYLREIKQTIGEYNPDMFLVEDYEYWIRISKRYQINHINQKHYYYRLHSNSLTEIKAMQVNNQLYRLRNKELNFFLTSISGQEKEMLFIDMVFQNFAKYDELKKKFYGEKLPQSLKWIERNHKLSQKRQIILVGAGVFGRKALNFFGCDRVFCFVDNDENIVGRSIQGKYIINFLQLKKIYKDYNIMISVDSRNLSKLANQLENNGMLEYDIYLTYIRCINNYIGIE